MILRRQHTFGGPDDRRGLRFVVRPRPDRRYVVRADHARNQIRIAKLLGRRDRGQPMPPYLGKLAGHRETPKQTDSRLQLRTLPRGALVGRRCRGPNRCRFHGLIEDVLLEPCERRAGIDA